MARTLPEALATELSATELKPFYAVEMGFTSGTLRFWTGYGDIEANGEDWTGSGTVLAISNSNETTDLSANGLTFTLNGLQSSIVSVMLSENYRGRPIKCYLGCLNSLNQPVSTLYQLFAGRMDVMSITEDGNTATITISAENVLIDLERPRMRKYTDEEQRKRYPGDNSLELIATLQDKQISWGK